MEQESKRTVGNQKDRGTRRSLRALVWLSLLTAGIAAACSPATAGEPAPSGVQHIEVTISGDIQWSGEADVTGGYRTTRSEDGLLQSIGGTAQIPGNDDTTLSVKVEGNLLGGLTAGTAAAAGFRPVDGASPCRFR